MKEKKIHELLAQQGIRLFNISLMESTTTLIHPAKTVEEWRNDLRDFIAELQQLQDEDDYSDHEIYNSLFQKLHEAGYVDVSDVVADVYEGRVAVHSASIYDDPAHEEQADGFGHYGWESKST